MCWKLRHTFKVDGDTHDLRPSAKNAIVVRRAVIFCCLLKASATPVILRTPASSVVFCRFHCLLKASTTSVVFRRHPSHSCISCSLPLLPILIRRFRRLLPLPILIRRLPTRSDSSSAVESLDSAMNRFRTYTYCQCHAVAA